MDDITVLMITDEAAQFHPYKVDKYFRVVETLTSAYKVVDCDGEEYHLFAQDVKLFTWRLRDWRDYCSR